MSLVLKSNVVSTAANLTSVALLTQTPQQYYDAFVARVQADGGEIVNSTELLNTINFLFDKKYILFDAILFQKNPEQKHFY